MPKFDVDVVRTVCNTSAGTQTITGSLGGETPNAAIFIVVGGVTEATAADTAILSYGAATSTTARWACGYYSLHGAAAAAVNYWMDNDECIQAYDNNSTLLFEADFSSFGANQVTINWATAPSSAYYLTVIMFTGDNLSAYAGVHDDLGDSVLNSVSVTAPSFKPSVLFGAFTSVTTLGTPNAGGVFSYGWATHTVDQTIYQMGSCYADEAVADTINIECACDYTLIMETNYSLGVNFRGVVTSFDTNGFTIQTQLGGASNGCLGYLALGTISEVQGHANVLVTPSSLGLQSYEAPGFQGVYLSLSQILTNNVATVYNAGGCPLGPNVHDPATTISNAAGSWDNLATSDTFSLSRSGTGIGLYNYLGTSNSGGPVTFDSLGFNINWISVQTGKRVPYLLLGEGSESGEFVFGEETPTTGDPVSWATWGDGAGGSAVIAGDADWGKLADVGRSNVYDLGSTIDRRFVLSDNDYGTGIGTYTLQIRGSDTVFTKDAGTPTWENYSVPIHRNWRYVQVGVAAS